MARLLLGLVAVALLGGCVSQKRVTRASSKVDLASAYFREGNYEGAVATFREATRLDPRNWRAWNALGLTYVAKGEVTLAREAFERALKINPGEGEILVNYGAFQVNQGEKEAAVATFELALKDLDYRNQAMVLSNLALAYLQVGRTDDALATAREAVRRTPALCEGWFHVGLALEAKSDPDGAIEAYHELMERCPTEAVGARLRVGCLQVRGPVPELGVRTLEEVLAEVPGTPMADEARACLREAQP